MVNANLKNGLRTIKRILKEKENRYFCLAGAISHDVSDISSQELSSYRGVGLIVDETNVDDVFNLATKKAVKYGEHYIYLLGTDLPPIVALKVVDYSFYLARNAQILAIVHA